LPLYPKSVVSELMEVDGIDVVGPLSAELQSPDLVYDAGGTFFPSSQSRQRC
jgi:hypothetical protein